MSAGQRAAAAFYQLARSDLAGARIWFDEAKREATRKRHGWRLRRARALENLCRWLLLAELARDAARRTRRKAHGISIAR